MQWLVFLFFVCVGVFCFCFCFLFLVKVATLEIFVIFCSFRIILFAPTAASGHGGPWAAFSQTLSVTPERESNSRFVKFKTENYYFSCCSVFKRLILEMSHFRFSSWFLGKETGIYHSLRSHTREQLCRVWGFRDRSVPTWKAKSVFAVCCWNVVTFFFRLHRRLYFFQQLIKVTRTKPTPLSSMLWPAATWSPINMKCLWH